MADEDTTEAGTGNSPEQSGTGQNDSERLGRLEDKVDKLAGLVARVLPGSHAEAQDRTEQHLDRGSSIEEAVQAELARRDKKAAEDQAAATAAAEKETLHQRLARLEEQPPQEPRSRLKRLAGGWG